jgi:histidinol dehydrogenase
MRPQRLADTDRKRFLQRRARDDLGVAGTVERILREVKEHGDVALRSWTTKLDGADLPDPWLESAEWDALAAKAPADVVAALRRNHERIRAFHALQTGSHEAPFESAPGVTLGRRAVAFSHVACYVPGGRAAYPSTVLMTVVPAVLAGVADIVIVTPPRSDGSIDPTVAAAARIAGATRILRAGGPQAVAAVAYGTASVPAVECIVGPGNAYVTAAKAKVAADGLVRTDAPAGPSELLVLADASARPHAHALALDLCAQAEHDPSAQVLLVTDDAPLADAVAAALGKVAAEATRRDIIAASLRDHGAILVADDWDAAVAFADDYAAEHLEIVSRDPHADFARIRNAGSVFLGPWAPVSLGDYGSGTNHVLPTMGLARLRGGLAVDDFRKWITWQDVTREGLEAIGDDVVAVARAEGLHAHADAVSRRLAP